MIKLKERVELIMEDKYVNRIFSVVVPSFNQLNLWKTAIDSILNQTYPAIQVVFCDDGTKNFNTQQIEDYIDKNGEGNIHSVVILRQDENIGTVKNLNAAHGYCIGYYITHIAADDAYADKNVLLNYAISLDKVTSDVCGIYGRALKCDLTLKAIGEDFIAVNVAKEYNSLSSYHQFLKMLQRCYVPMGATAFVMKTFKDYIPFDERYSLIEDWPFFLRVTKEGKRLEFCDFPALLYRAGGVTSGGNARAYEDHLKLYDNEIWPYSRLLTYKELFKMAYKYDYDRHFMKKITGPIESKKRIKFLKSDIRIIGILADKLFKQKEFGEDLKTIYQKLALYLFNPFQ